MKMKEVCARAGLTERAVRLYIERGLLSPAAEERGERVYLDFSEDDVETLRAIGRLRELDFSLDDIRQMQLFPDRARELVFEHRKALIGEARGAERDVAALRQMERCDGASLRELAQASRYQPPTAPPSPPPRENTSGRGDSAYGAQAPRCGRWNWGAFLLPIPWGIGNRCYIAFLCFAPLVGLFMPFYLGARGYELAWKNKYWDSEAHFLRVQKKWAWWGAGISAALLALYLLAWRADTRRQAALEAEYQAALERQEQREEGANTSGYAIGYDLMEAIDDLPEFRAALPDGWQLDPTKTGDPCAYSTANYGDDIIHYLFAVLTVYRLDRTPCLVRVSFDADGGVESVSVAVDMGDPWPEGAEG